MKFEFPWSLPRSALRTLIRQIIKALSVDERLAVVAFDAILDPNDPCMANATLMQVGVVALTWGI